MNKYYFNEEANCKFDHQITKKGRRNIKPWFEVIKIISEQLITAKKEFMKYRKYNISIF